MSSNSVTSTNTRTAQPRSAQELEASLGLESRTVCVLHGGRSDEREVSIRSGREIREALGGTVGREDRRGPGSVLGVEIALDGRWVLDGEPLLPGRALERLADVDLFFLAVHGGEGEDGTLQGLLASHGRAFTGTGVTGSACAMDKVVARHLVAGAGLRVARALWFSACDWNAAKRDIHTTLADWQAPGWVIKPRTGGSSVGCSVIRAASELPTALESAFAFEDLVLVEELIEGVEVAAAVLEASGRGLEPLPIVEIRPRGGHFFDYEQKYSASGAEELCPPVSLGMDCCERLQVLALDAHRSLRCEGFSRTDFIVPCAAGESDDPGRQAAFGEPVFLETNTLPGMTARSLLPLASATAGIDFRTLCLSIAARALGL